VRVEVCAKVGVRLTCDMVLCRSVAVILASTRATGRQAMVHQVPTGLTMRITGISSTSGISTFPRLVSIMICLPLNAAARWKSLLKYCNFICTQVMIKCLDSGDFVHIRNALIVLIQVRSFNLAWMLLRPFVPSAVH
jgi:hypothetical protein